MAENVELIAAADLPMATTSEINILCVENGELKQKSGASIAGAGCCVYLDDSMIDSSSDHVSFIYPESYDVIANTLANHGTVWVDLSACTSLMGDVSGILTASQVVTWMYDPITPMFAFAFFAGELVEVRCTNGTWTPPESSAI